ncbi:MAG: nucleotide sugar dehydrogenase, partial [Selenomonadaceae bacterium]
MKMLERLQKKEASLAVVGLGYVGLPLAVAFGEKFKTIGFDINERKVALYREGLDPTHEVGNQRVEASPVEFTADPAVLRRAAFIIIAVPTPIHADKTPDLLPLLSACRLVGENLSPGSIIVFESTVYPGVTEEICLPLIEKTCGLQCGTSFSAGYSPERINPGDLEHRLENIKKLVAAVDDRTLAEISAVYNEIITAGVYPTANIKVAETAKLVENTQRDVNIAFMNEMAMFCARLGISTGAVLEAMNTKWNALKFTPGLVGGHCIGVDPWYFIYKAEMLGYHSPLVTGARKINDEMGFYVAEAIVKKLLQAGCNMQQAKIYILGVSYKENCPDVRNSKAWDIAR